MKPRRQNGGRRLRDRPDAQVPRVEWAHVLGARAPVGGKGEPVARMPYDAKGKKVGKELPHIEGPVPEEPVKTLVKQQLADDVAPQLSRALCGVESRQPPE